MNNQIFYLSFFLFFLSYEALNIPFEEIVKKTESLFFLNNLTFIVNDDIVNNNELFGYYNYNENIIEVSDKYYQQNELIVKAKYFLKEGWNNLYINTYKGKSNISTYAQCYSAGLLEGLISTEDIFNYFNNIKSFHKGISDVKIKKLYKLYETLYINLLNRLSNKTNFMNDVNSKYSACIISQILGIYHGYSNKNKNTNQFLSILDFIHLSSSGNFNDFIKYIQMNDSFESQNTQSILKDEEILSHYNKLQENSHCSVIAKLVHQVDSKGNKKYDIISGHSTWSSYVELIRTLKCYNFEMDFNNQSNNDNNIRINHKINISFSSYPGVLFSADDYYVINSRLSIHQTTLNTLNDNIYVDVINYDKFIFAFIKIMTVNFRSNSAKEWVSLYTLEKNSLYITQWVVVDYKVLEDINKLIKRQNEEDIVFFNELIYIVEEIPRQILNEDSSKRLYSTGYITSFNSLYFKENKKLMGYENYSIFNLNSSRVYPREYIANKIHSSILNINDFNKNLISYNGFQLNNKEFDDPSDSNPTYGIMSRGDLKNIDKSYQGGIDYKTINLKMIKQNKFYAKLGPTSYGNCGIFEFNDNDDMTYYKGVSRRFNFSEIVFSFEY